MSVPTNEYELMVQREIKREREIAARVRELAQELAETCAPIWHWGDGFGGVVRMNLDEAFRARGLPFESDAGSRGSNRKPIAASKRTAVFERDEYRCKQCATHIGLQIDHVIPVSRGGGNEVENLQTLCGPCNASKSDRSP